MDVSHTIIPKSDQLNADDLLTGPIVVKIEDVTEGPKDQPVIIKIRGVKPYQPWKPCKSMRRVLILLWGADATKWIGRYIKLYCDPNVRWAGSKVGGIRICAASIPAAIEFPLTVSRGKKELVKIIPLVFKKGQTNEGEE